MEHYPHGPKADWDRQADLIAGGGIIIEDSDLHMLLEWMKDMNWPGAPTISAFIKTRGSATIEPLRRTLGQMDPVWNYWLLAELGREFGAAYWASLLPELRIIASSHDDESANIEALSIIYRYSLEPLAEIIAIASKLKKDHSISDEEVENLNSFIDSLGEIEN